MHDSNRSMVGFRQAIGPLAIADAQAEATHRIITTQAIGHALRDRHVRVYRAAKGFEDFANRRGAWLTLSNVAAS
jgi:hypothetical protein